LRKLKILVVTVAMTLVFATPAFADVLGPTEITAGNFSISTGGLLGPTAIEVGNLTLSTD
jgi:hypothetical protein